jgi:hypothetical protein
VIDPHADKALLEALAAVVAALKSFPAHSMVIGGIAVIAHGVPRQTVDVDATVWGAETELDDLFQALARHGIVPRIPDAHAFARERQVLLLQHEPSGTPLEVSLAWLPFELEAMGRAVTARVGSLEFPIARPEDLIIYKALAWRDRDRSDIERLLVLHREAVDLDRVRDFVRQFAEILSEPARVAEFESLMQRVAPA